MASIDSIINTTTKTTVTGIITGSVTLANSGEASGNTGVWMRVYKDSTVLFDGPVTSVTVPGKTSVSVQVSASLGAAPSLGNYSAQLIIGDLDPVTGTYLGLKGSVVSGTLITVQQSPASITVTTVTWGVS